MTTVAELLSKERAQDEWLVQSMLGKAIEQSLQEVIREPLSNEMALLLLRLAAAQAIMPRAEEARSAPETTLDRATRYVARAKVIVARQRERITQLQSERRPLEDAVHMLNIFLQTLASMEHHLRLLRDEAEGRDKVPEWITSRLASRLRVAA